MRGLRQLLLITTLLSGCDGEPPDTRPLGPSDTAAMRSCTPPAAMPITAATTAAAASSAVIHLPEEAATAGNAYRVTLPASAEGFATLEVHTIHNDVALFVSDRGMITNLTPDGIPSGLRHAVCPDTLIDDYRVHIDDPGQYTLTFSATGPREITVVAILARLGHDDDAGVHDHDGGHDVDAGVDADGAAHDPDGGH